MCQEHSPLHHHDSAAEHDHLRTLVEEISRCLFARSLTPPELSQRLAHLHAELLEHFRREESGGYFAGVVEVAPQLAERADALLSQHPDLEQRIEQLRAMAREDFSGTSRWRQIASVFSQFHDEFGRHERREEALLQEAYTLDIGTDD